MTAIGRVDGLVIDGDDTIALARFWSAMFDTEIASIANEGEPNEAHYIDVATTLGGSLIQPTQTEYGYDFAVMGDPEGNEFCLITPAR